MKKIIMFTALLLNCCAPMPGNNLMDGIKEPAEIQEIKIVEHNLGYLEGGWKCAGIMGWAKGLHPLVIQIPGCVQVHYDNTGKPDTCHIYKTAGLSWMAMGHEKRHCMGYADRY